MGPGASLAGLRFAAIYCRFRAIETGQGPACKDNLMEIEQIIKELGNKVKFKDSTDVGDIILMVNETEEPQTPFGVAYAVINGFEPDPAKKDEWWFVSLTFLAIPPEPRTLILQRPHFTGEIFTMGGRKVFIKAVDLAVPPTEPLDGDGQGDNSDRRSGLRRVK